MFQTDRKRRWHYTPPNIFFRITKNKELDKIIHFISEQIFYQDYTKIKLLGNGIWQKGTNSANPHSCWQKVYRKLIFRRNTIWISLAGKKYKKRQLDTHVYICVCVSHCLFTAHLMAEVCFRIKNKYNWCMPQGETNILEILVFYLLFTCK